MLSLKKLTLTGALILVLLAAPLAVVQADIPGLVSDDFHNGYDATWVEDDLEEYEHDPDLFSLEESGGDSYLQIAIPDDGVKRSLSASATSLQAPRLLQAVSDPNGNTEFTFTVRFLGVPSYSDGSYAAMQGIVIKGVYDPDDIPGVQNYPSYWRFSIDTGGSANQVKPFASWFYQLGPNTFGGYNDIFPTSPFERAANSPILLRVVRTVEHIVDQDGENDWSTFSFAYSINEGSTWTTLTARTEEGTGPLNEIRQTFKVTHIGVFAGSTEELPPYTAKIDWVSITDEAPDNEDEDPPVTTFTLTTNVSPSGAGSVAVSPQKASYTAGEQVTVTANAASGYVFQNWTVNGVTQTGNPYTFPINQNTTVSAVFVSTTPGETKSVFLPMVMR